MAGLQACSLVQLCQLNVLVVGNELFDHHGSTAYLDDEMLSQVLDGDLLVSIHVVALADSLPWNEGAMLIDVLSELFIDDVALDWYIDLWSHWLWLLVQESPKLVLQIENHSVLHINLLLDSLHLIVSIFDLALNISDDSILAINLLLLPLKSGLKILKLLLVLGDLSECLHLLSSKNLDLLAHVVNLSVLFLEVVRLLLFESLVLLQHLVQLVHARLVEFNVLLNIHLVAVHDVSQAVGHLVGKVLLRSLINKWHQIEVQFLVLLIEELAALLDLREVGSVWLLVFADVSFHDVPDADEALVSVLLGCNDLEDFLVVLSHSVLQICT